MWFLASCFTALFVYPANSGETDLQGSPTETLEVIIRFGGDLLLAHHYEEAVGDDIHRAFSDFDLFKTDHISMVNLEVPVTVRGKRQEKPFTFRMKPRFLDVITGAGIEVVNIANNHIHDFGKDGLFDTLDFLDSAGIARVGAGRTHAEAHQAVIKTVSGRRVAFLGYYNGGEAPAAKGKSFGVADRVLKLIQRDIKLLKKNSEADYIVVNFHWGIEKARKPDATQRAFAHRVIEAGADAIIGHHPHVLQGIELYKGKVIAYSLGNLIFGGNSRHTYDTGLLEIRLTSEGPKYSFIPVHVKEWKASTATGADADSLLKEMKQLSSIFPKSIFH